MTERKRTAIVAIVAVLSVVLASLGSFAAVITKSGEQVMATIWAEDNRADGSARHPSQQPNRPDEAGATAAPSSPTSAGKGASTPAGSVPPGAMTSSGSKKSSGSSQSGRPAPAAPPARRAPATSAPAGQPGTTGAAPSVGLPPKQQLPPPRPSTVTSKPVILPQSQWPQHRCVPSSLGPSGSRVVVEFFGAPANSTYFVQVTMNGMLRVAYLNVGAGGGYGSTTIMFDGPPTSCTLVGVTRM